MKYFDSKLSNKSIVVSLGLILLVALSYTFISVTSTNFYEHPKNSQTSILTTNEDDFNIEFDHQVKDITKIAVKGPGLPTTPFTEDEVGTILSQNNTGKAISAVVMHNGYLFVPLGADHGGGVGAGAFAFYDVSDPKNIKKVFDSRDHREIYHDKNLKNYVGNWAEIHSLPLVGNKMVISERDRNKGGIAIFDPSNLYDNDPETKPEIISRVSFPGVNGTTNYDGYSFSMAMKGGRYVYAPAGTYGLFVVDVLDLYNPKVVARIPNSELSNRRMRSAVVIGDWLILHQANNNSGFIVMDITNPIKPVRIGFQEANMGYQGFMYGSEFFSVAANAGVTSYDISDPSNIKKKVYNQQASSVLKTPEYGFGKDNFAFIGHYPGMSKWDLENPQNEVASCSPLNPFSDDYAFITPIGNIIVIASDHNHANKLNFGVHQKGIDNLPADVNFILPKDGSVSVDRNASIGISFTDFIDVLSINKETLQLRHKESGTISSGTYSQMFGFVNFLPSEPLEKNTEYEVILKKDGVKDWSGNAVTTDKIITTFTTGEKIQNVHIPELKPTTPSIAGDTVEFGINANGVDLSGMEFAWDFGDDTPITSFSTNTSISHTYIEPGNFTVILQIQIDDINVQLTTVQRVTAANINQNAYSRSSKIIFDSANNLVWNVNPDNNSVSAINADTYALVHETLVDKNPQSLAISQDNQLWVVSKDNNVINVINTATGRVEKKHQLPYGSNPTHIVIDKNAKEAYISLEAKNQLVKLSTVSGNILRTIKVGKWPGNLVLDTQKKKLWVAKFISPNESGKISIVNTDTFDLVNTISLQPSTNPESETNGRGLPNYLGAMAIAPDGSKLFVPSKKDNIYRGGNRDGKPLTFESTVRSMGAQIDVSKEEEVFSNRIDFDNNDFATAAVYSHDGNDLFVSSNGTATIWIVDAYDHSKRSEVSTGGQAPDGMTLSADGKKLFVHNFLSRSVVAFETPIGCKCSSMKKIGERSVVSNETLDPEVLKGKILFYDTKDIRLAQDGYMSCASCHLNGGHDGRVWDITNLGEGFRNTISLKNKKGHGRLHWSANFDEVQDFEIQIRALNLGAGLMSDVDFAATQDPLGAPKKGKSKDLDALAAYVNSLTNDLKSPFTDEGNLTDSGKRGKGLFNSFECAKCHSGDDFTDSALSNMHDIGTIKETSGSRLGDDLKGLDTPTLLGLWNSAPYLHDGSAATIADAIKAHTKEVLLPENDNQLQDLVAYMNQLSGNSRESDDIIAETQPEIYLYPNPVVDRIYVSKIKKETTIFVYNMMGQKMIVNTVDELNNSIDLSSLPIGSYIVKVGKDLVKAIIKK